MRLQFDSRRESEKNLPGFSIVGFATRPIRTGHCFNGIFHVRFGQAKDFRCFPNFHDDHLLKNMDD